MKKYYDCEDDDEMIEKKITINFGDNKKPDDCSCEKPACEKQQCCEGIKIDMNKCEEAKEVCLLETCDDNVRILKIKVNMEHLCANRNINIAVQLTDCKCGKIISQKGKTVYTGDGNDCKNRIEACFYFALVGNLCECVDDIVANVVANYINYCCEEKDCNNNCGCK